MVVKCLQSTLSIVPSLLLNLLIPNQSKDAKKISAISATSSSVMSRPIISGQSLYFQMTFKKSHQGLVVISQGVCYIMFQ